MYKQSLFMKHKTFIINALKSNNMASLQKYHKLTKKLSQKDKKFNKYLLQNNISIDQLGGNNSGSYSVTKSDINIYQVRINSVTYTVTYDESNSCYNVYLTKAQKAIAAGVRMRERVNEVMTVNRVHNGQ